MMHMPSNGVRCGHVFVNRVAKKASRNSQELASCCRGEEVYHIFGVRTARIVSSLFTLVKLGDGV